MQSLQILLMKHSFIRRQTSPIQKGLYALLTSGYGQVARGSLSLVLASVFGDRYFKIKYTQKSKTLKVTGLKVKR